MAVVLAVYEDQTEASRTRLLEALDLDMEKVDAERADRVLEALLTMVMVITVCKHT